jgi:uncharacterized phage-associated protein
MPNPIFLVANTILLRARERCIEITPMKMQKLMYFVYKYVLKKQNYTIFDAQFEAWQYGPVLSDLYYNLSEYGGEAFTEPIKDSNGKVYMVNDDDPDNTPVLDAIDFVLNKYGKYNGGLLSYFTHTNVGNPDQKTAWKQAQDAGQLYISPDDIRAEAWIEG